MLGRRHLDLGDALREAPPNGVGGSDGGVGRRPRACLSARSPGPRLVADRERLSRCLTTFGREQRLGGVGCESAATELVDLEVTLEPLLPDGLVELALVLAEPRGSELELAQLRAEVARLDRAAEVGVGELVDSTRVRESRGIRREGATGHRRRVEDALFDRAGDTRDSIGDESPPDCHVQRPAARRAAPTGSR